MVGRDGSGAHRDKRWDLDRYADLVRDVDAYGERITGFGANNPPHYWLQTRFT
jgi:hypothetical protein